jgi:Zn-dependent protease with chaperone function
MRRFEEIFKYNVALEDNFKGIDYKLINSNDPVISMCGGACTFNSSSNTINNSTRFLKDIDGYKKGSEKRTNNPTLIEECQQVSNTPIGTPIIIFHNDLIKTLSADEEKAILYHEIGHIHHQHNKKTESGTAGSFIEMELEADQYAIDEVGPKVLHNALEKCLTFGAKFSIIALKETSPSFIKKMLSVGIINRYMIGSIYKMNKKMHIQRFKTLKQLEKQK